MARWCDVGIDADAIIGKSIDMEDLFDRRIVIEKVKIEPTKFPGKNASGMRMQMQVVLAEFNTEADADGDYFVKDAEGRPKGERRSCFTGSDSLMNQINKGEESFTPQKLQSGKMTTFYPIDTTIAKVGKCFVFT